MQFSAALQRGPRRGGGFSAGLPPTSGQRPGSAHPTLQHQPAGGPSRPSLSGNQSQAATAGAALSLPSTLAVALGALSPPAGGLLAQLTPTHGSLALPTPPPPGAAGLAGLLPLAASMGLQPSQLGSMAAALLQAQSSVLGTQQQHTPQGQQASEQQLAAAGKAAQGGQQGATAGSPPGVMPPPPPLQVLQQAEALQSMAAMLQAQASAIMNGTPSATPPAGVGQQPQQQSPGGAAATPACNLLPSAAAAAPPQEQHAPASLGNEAGQAQPAASLGAASVQSLPSLVGASAIQGHPLPPPTAHRAGRTPLPLQSFGGTPGALAGAVAAPPTVQSGAFPPPGPTLAAATPAQVAAAVSEMQGSAIQPAAAALVHPAAQRAEQPAAGSGLDAPAAAVASPLQQAASAVLGTAGPFSRSSDLDQVAEAERRRHAGDPPQPQAATIQELPTADVAAASQGGGMDGRGGTPGPPLPPAMPQDAAMLGGNSAFGDAVEPGAGATLPVPGCASLAAPSPAGRHLCWPLPLFPLPAPSRRCAIVRLRACRRSIAPVSRPAVPQMTKSRWRWSSRRLAGWRGRSSPPRTAPPRSWPR